MGACEELCTGACAAASAGTDAAPISYVRARTFLRELGRHFLDDNVQNAGAMMAYYSVLALFPMLVLVLALAMLVIPTADIQQGAQLATAAVPPAARSLLVGRIHAFMHQSHSTFAIVGALLALLSARGGLTSLMQALNGMFHTRETRSWVRRQIIAILLATFVAVLVVVALGLLVAGSLAEGWLADRVVGGAVLAVAWNVVRWVGATLLVMFVWALFYKFLPDTDAPFRLFTPGAITGVVLWLAASYGFGVYLGHVNSYETTYGALGGAIIFLVWLWFSHMALFVGAEINDLLAHANFRPRAPDDERAVSSARSADLSAKPEAHGVARTTQTPA